MTGFYEEKGEKYSVAFDQKVFHDGSFGEPSYDLVPVFSSNEFTDCLDKALELDKEEKGKYYIFDNDNLILITINEALLFMCQDIFE